MNFDGYSKKLIRHVRYYAIFRRPKFHCVTNTQWCGSDVHISLTLGLNNVCKFMKICIFLFYRSFSELLLLIQSRGIKRWTYSTILRISLIYYSLEALNGNLKQKFYNTLFLPRIIDYQESQTKISLLVTKENKASTQNLTERV